MKTAFSLLARSAGAKMALMMNMSNQEAIVMGGQRGKSGQRRGLYPEIEPYRTGRLRVSPMHELYYEESGNPEGKPVVFLHGGPGGGTDPSHRRFFDPAHYRIVLFDQRGCGRSTPHATLDENTTWHLVSDMEVLREHLQIRRWQVFGGSWGSTLGLIYAQTHPDRVTELVLRGIFLQLEAEVAWFYQRGTSCIYPDAWEDFVRPIPEEERRDLIHAYYCRLNSPDRAVQLEAARAWSRWEGRTCKLIQDPALVARVSEDQMALALARIECHYIMHRGFLLREGQILEGMERVRHIPGVIVHGRYDMVCPVESAWRLHRLWPSAELRIVPDAGHSALEPGIVHELVLATDRFRAG